ncbi:YlxR family protein [Patescibacteria group bacterium]|nr:YlxR family protein [Patescibacteria group bacterium]
MTSVSMNSKKDKKPTMLRACIGCQTKKNKSSLVRIVYDQKLLIDPTGQKESRGIYLCPEEACFQKAIKKNAFSYRLKKKIKPEVVNQLFKEFTD